MPLSSVVVVQIKILNSQYQTFLILFVQFGRLKTGSVKPSHYQIIFAREHVLNRHSTFCAQVTKITSLFLKGQKLRIVILYPLKSRSFLYLCTTNLVQHFALQHFHPVRISGTLYFQLKYRTFNNKKKRSSNCHHSHP